MNSTITNHVQELRHNPKNITKLTEILQLLIIESNKPSFQFSVLQEINNLFKEYYRTLSPQVQKKSYSFLIKQTTVYGEILFNLLFCNLLPCLGILVQLQTFLPKKKYFAESLINKIIDGKAMTFSVLNDSQFLNSIFEGLLTKMIYTPSIMKFMLEIPHMSDISSESKNNEPKKSQEESSKNMRQNYEKLIIQLIRLSEKQDLKEKLYIYRNLGDRVFSKFFNPLRLAEFLLQKFEHEVDFPEVQIQVISCLFILVGKYGLEMEMFYQKLQMMMVNHSNNEKKSLFKLSNSKRFLKLLQSAMKSSRVPFRSILSLTKLVVSRIYHEESEFAFWALSFFVNLVKKHRNLQKHLSEIPEIEGLKNHYSPKIRSLISQLSKNLNKSEYLDIEQFAKINYNKLCNDTLATINNKLEEQNNLLEFRIK